MVWQVAHCCLNSVAPSGGLAAGSGICAPAIVTTSDCAAKSQPDCKCRAQLCHMHHRRRAQSLGRGEQAVVVAGCFTAEQKQAVVARRFGQLAGWPREQSMAVERTCRADAPRSMARRDFQSSKPPEPRLALMSLRRFLPSSRRCFDPSVGLVGRRGIGPHHGLAQEFDQPVDGVGAVALLGAEALRVNHDHAVLGHALAGEPVRAAPRRPPAA